MSYKREWNRRELKGLPLLGAKRTCPTHRLLSLSALSSPHFGSLNRPPTSALVTPVLSSPTGLEVPGMGRARSASASDRRPHGTRKLDSTNISATLFREGADSRFCSRRRNTNVGEVLGSSHPQHALPGLDDTLPYYEPRACARSQSMAEGSERTPQARHPEEIPLCFRLVND